MKILSVIGTRPEAVKMAPVVQELNRTPGIEARTCVTAQHRELLDQVLRLFEIKPEYDLDLMSENQSLVEISRRVFQDLDPVLAEFEPDWVLVQGDTTTVAITSLLCYYRHILVGHVEAGLRTHDKWQPFPEEINRRVAGVVADLHFAPTEWARQNLLKEGIAEDLIKVTGNPVIDALQYVSSQRSPVDVESWLKARGITPATAGLPGPQEKKLILVTAHRRENFGRPLEEICAALQDLAGRGDVAILYAVHPNPNVLEPVRRFLGNIANIFLMPALDYLTLIHYIKNSTMVLTDSGGIQEEAPAFGIPVLVLRSVTERPEGVDAGVLRLVGTEREVIVREASHLLEDADAYASMARKVNPFGDGHAAQRIVQALISQKTSV